MMPSTRTRVMVVIMRRALLGFCLGFLDFDALVFLVGLLAGFFISSIGVSLMVNSPPSLRSKALTGLRKSSTD